ncbi:hypothetical protein TNCV_1335651 [Trichonephila clavipes]|nr:hypothetical protein TNCV_1335651 [Trichonephila clavipes]
MLSEHYKKQQMSLSLQHFLCYRDDDDDFLQHIGAYKPDVTTFSRKEIRINALLEFKRPDVSINVQRYTQTLDKLHKAIKNKRTGMTSSGVIIRHDDGDLGERLHVAKVWDSNLSLCDYTSLDR